VIHTSDDKSQKLQAQKETTLQRLLASGTVTQDAVLRAFREVPREKFVRDHHFRDAYVDTPLPIGEGQTISAIHMCLIYLELLDLHEGLRVLEIGGGSGYHAALVAEMVAPKGAEKPGHVYTVERRPNLVEFAKENLKKSGYSDRVTVILADGTLGYREKAPYDRIMVAAAAPRIPDPLIEQLAIEGKMLIPVGRNHFWQELMLVTKKKAGKIESRRTMAVAFVPLIGEEGWPSRE
jgi:protein-L-isoaspartate(D-aspartate) O-methyltransferase